jgi:alanyl-tRNA synthetase
MMTSREIRQKFLDFFESKQHKIVPSAPIVVKGDPTLMFTNAGMNQFKDYFLGNKQSEVSRIADTQKCLRVSGKHNDLEEVGRDSYHHTMFEMLGNWSFGDYFKKEAINWAWELLTEVYGLPKDRLYVSVFKGEESEGLEPDEEAADFWKQYVPADRILYFDKKDNFWEMGDTGPCGPCSEIHVDLRSDEDRAKTPGQQLVNADSPEVIEIWNLVFIQFNRKADGSLEELPAKHVDTGMGFERLTMALQGKKSNYDTDIFSPFIEFIEKESGKKYTGSYAHDAMSDIAMRVISDHIRAVSFTIADGELPSNTGAGYVIRRILRRAVRYYYSFLDINEPFLYKLIPLLAKNFNDVFPELAKQEDFVTKVILEEEKSFLRTLEEGLKRFETIDQTGGVVDGKAAFELYDTYGFPIDLTRLMATEKGWTLDEKGFNEALEAQKARSRADAQKETGDWTTILDNPSVEFVGYDDLTVSDANVIKYRTVKVKGKPQFQLVLNRTPFYAESGGQAGDTGLLTFDDEKIKVLDTQKENDLIIHVVDKFPVNLNGNVTAAVDATKRQSTSSNHSATHLMHAALHKILGNHATQRGQNVDDKRLRFDFSHFQKMSEDELKAVENMVNEKVRQNIALEEDRNVPIAEAEKMGAMMLFGEKYGEEVRVITFDKDFSRELCGGTHVPSTGEIGLFKIVAEGAVAAGVRRIEAVTGAEADAFMRNEMEELEEVRALFPNPKNLAKQVADLQEENKALKKQIEKFVAEQASGLQKDLQSKFVDRDSYKLLTSVVNLDDAGAIKTLAYNLEKDAGDCVIVFGAEIGGKPRLFVLVSKSLIDAKGYNAGNTVRELAKNIKGGGGGQPFYAEAGGADASGLENAMKQAGEMF